MTADSTKDTQYRQSFYRRLDAIIRALAATGRPMTVREIAVALNIGTDHGVQAVAHAMGWLRDHNYATTVDSGRPARWRLIAARFLKEGRRHHGGIPDGHREGRP